MRVHILMSYVISGGFHSWYKHDYKIVDVFSNRKKAKEVCDLKNDRSQYRRYEIKTKTIKEQ